MEPYSQPYNTAQQTNASPVVVQQPQSKKTKYIIVGLVIVIIVVAVLVVFLLKEDMFTNEDQEEVNQEVASSQEVQEEYISPSEESIIENEEQQPEQENTQPVAIAKPGGVVLINNSVFQPSNVEISQGEAIVWFNDDSAEHIIKIGTEESPSLKNGEAYAKEFSEKGTYNYECKIHPEMKGIVTVI